MIETARYRMPAEWDVHERTLMAWPANRSLWGSLFQQAKDEYAAVARAIARFEPVLTVAQPAQADEARRQCGTDIEVVALAIDDSWMRDCGPIIVRDSSGHRVGVQFGYNAYGERFTPYDRDASIATRVCELLGMPTRRCSLVLEGGSIVSDGQGTLITTEQCLLNPNRNPGRSRAEIEDELRAQLGVEKIIWLPWGRVEDLHTDGHVDVVCMFVAPGVVVVQGCDDSADPNYERLRANRSVLDAATDARGRRLDIIELPMQPLVKVNGHPTLVGNNNFYLANGAVVVPVADEASGDGVADIFARACPGRQFVPVQASVIGFGGGGIHCITQQVPSGA